MTSGAFNNTTGRASPPSQNLPPSTSPASPPSKRDLRSWWKNFKLPSKQPDIQHDHRGPGIFGVPLRTSITYANVAISLVDENGRSYIYGYVPIVVAKCGVFLKEKATSIEGIFRLSGSEKRIKELKIIFDSPDRYGKGLSWDGYTVHDAANVLRRYLNDLPEPVVPLDLYERFRDPLRGATKQAVGDSEGPQFIDSFDETAAIECYQTLITELPPLNKQLLLYILDLLAVFAAKSDENRMTSQNLAAIFQPGMLSHPTHAMAPDEYRLNQCVIIFLIENQDHFLIGMQGTAADEKTMKEVASGSPNGPTTSPNRKSGLGRTASNSSAGAESVRRDGQVRRNRSVSSRQSRVDGAVTPNSPSLTATPTGGLGRSNTLPSKRSPALIGAKFRYVSPGRAPQSPAPDSLNQSHQDEVSLYDAGESSQGRSSHSRSQDRLLDIPHPHDAATPPKDRSSQNSHHLFQRSPLESNEKRQPKKLRKRRIPGTINLSAQSSCASLPPQSSANASPTIESPDPLESPPQVPMLQARPISQSYPNHSGHIWKRHSPSQSLSQQVAPPVEGERPGDTPSGVHHDGPTDSNHRASHSVSHSSLHPEDGPRGRRSPPQSIHSSFNDGSDVDQIADETVATASADHGEKEKRHRWRLSRGKKEDFVGLSGSPLMAPHMNIGSNHNAEISTTSIGSALHRPSKSVTRDSSEHSPSGGERASAYENGRDDTKGPFSWIKTKYREAKGNADHKRCKSPPPSEPHHMINPDQMAPRGKSLDMKRIPQQEEDKMTVREVPPEKPLEMSRELAQTAQAIPKGHVETQGHCPPIDDALNEEPVLIEMDAPGAVPVEAEPSANIKESAPSRNTEILQAALAPSAPPEAIQQVPSPEELRQPAALGTAEERRPDQH